jgi:hypothetical protein
MTRGRRGGMRRWQELARLAMEIATKEENVQRETSPCPLLRSMPNQGSGVQDPVDERKRVSLEVRELL